MKKITLLVLLCLIGCFALTAACAETTAEAPAGTAAEGTAPITLLDRAWLIAEDRDNLIEMTADDLYDLIGIAPEDYSDFAYLAHVDPLTGRELIVLYAVDEDAAQRIITMLNDYLEIRLHETRNYLPEIYRVLSESEVARKDLLVVLSLAAPNTNEQELLLTAE